MGAHTLYASGRAALSDAKYGKALELFRLALDATPKSDATMVVNCLRGVGASLYGLGRLDEALEIYERMALEHGRNIDSPTTKRLEERVDEIRRRLGYVQISANVDGIVVVDDRVRGTLPLRAPIPVIAGKAHHVVIRKAGRETAERKITVGAGKTKVVVVRLRAVGSTLWGEVHGGPAFGVAYGGVEPTCGRNACSFSPGTSLGAVRFGYDFGNRWSVQGGAGYSYLPRSGVRRRSGQPFGDFGQVAKYEITDHLRVHGAFLSGGIGYRTWSSRFVGVSTYLHLAPMVVFSRDDMQVRASVTNAGDTPPRLAQANGIGITKVSFALPVLFGVDVLIALDEAPFNPRGVPVHLAIGLMAMFQPMTGPKRGYGQLTVPRSGQTCGPYPVPVECVPANADALANERAYSRSLLLAPNVGVGYRF